VRGVALKLRTEEGIRVLVANTSWKSPSFRTEQLEET
jgi:hypothetical protein